MTFAVQGTRVSRLYAVSPRTRAIDLQLNLNVGNSALIAGVAALTVKNNAALGAAESGALASAAAKLSKAGGDTLTGIVDLKVTDNYNAGIRVGSVTWNTTTGALDVAAGKNGVVMTRKGLLGVKDGVATFWLNAATGDATFSGTVAGAVLNIGSGNTPGGFAFEVNSAGAFWTDSILGGIGYFSNAAALSNDALTGVAAAGSTKAGVAGLSANAAGYGVHAKNTAGGISLYSEGWAEVGGTLRATGQTTGMWGVGVEMVYVAGVGYVQAYDWDNTLYKPLRLDGSTLTLALSGAPAVSITAISASGIKFDGYTGGATWATGDRYLVVSTTGVVHVSSIGPGS
ncbi:MAG: hypothetical protein RLZZ200_2596 [Pseudomonadota bacterium]|jgi:hypothetical protein